MTHMERIAMLLDVLHKAAAAGPDYAWIVSLATAELNHMKPMPAPTSPPPVVPTAAITTPVPPAPPLSTTDTSGENGQEDLNA